MTENLTPIPLNDPGEIIAARKYAFAQSIETLYTVFKRYRLNKSVTGCDHCVFPEDNELLHSKKLRELTGHDLSKYSWKAMTTWGDVDDFRHFLPRLFELMCKDDDRQLADSPVVTGKLVYGEWNKWPAEEREALLRFFQCYWEYFLAQYPCSFGDADETLCTISRAQVDLSALLAFWLRDPSQSAAEHLADFINSSVPNLGRKKSSLGDAFWETGSEQHGQVVSWLRTDPLRDLVERLFFEYETTNSELAARLSLASGMLDILRSVHA